MTDLLDQMYFDSERIWNSLKGWKNIWKEVKQKDDKKKIKLIIKDKIKNINTKFYELKKKIKQL